MSYNKPIRRIAIVGTGVIGASWAAEYLARGFDVVATDPAPNAEANLRKYVDEAWKDLTDIGLSKGASRDRLTFTTDMKEALSKADFVQENGPERPDFKMKLFADMDDAAPVDSIIASSSSGITPSVMQSKAKHPERILVGHPFNPPHIIPLVEVVGGTKTSPDAIQQALAFYASIGKKPIELKKELPGHVGNRLQAALYKEIMYLIQHDVLSVEDADVAVSYGPGPRWGVMGPSLQWHLGGGAGGIKHFMDHLMDPLTAMIKTLGTPDVTPELKQTIVEGVLREAGNRSVDELAQEENELIIGLLRSGTLTNNGWTNAKYAGGVIGQTLAMEGMFAFFLESAFVGALIWGEKRLGPHGHFAAALAVALGSWLSGYFILVTNAFMQHPVGYQIEANGSLGIASMSAYLLNPWAFVQFAHNQLAAVVTGSFVVAAIGAFYALRDLHPVQVRLYLRAGTFVGLIASLLVAFPTGDQQAKIVGNHQPITLAAMEGKFEGGAMAPVTLIGQPNVAKQRLENPIEVPGALSFLAYGHFGSFVHGLNDFPKDAWPDNLELLYYSFHIMITLGTLFIVLMGFATLENWRGRLESNRLLLWILMLAFPYPYIANTLGWMTAELGRQPWLIYGLFHTRDGYSKVVSNGDAIFTLIGFTGLYFVLGLLFLGLTGREIAKGPEQEVVGSGEAARL